MKESILCFSYFGARRAFISRYNTSASSFGDLPSEQRRAKLVVTGIF
jgi:hypothetical protein